MAALIHLESLSMGLHLCHLKFFCIASILPLLEDEQKFNLGGCVGAHKTPILCTNMSSKYIK
jgi:hypothetical protein